MSLDTVCRLYEVGRQKLAEEGDDDEDEVTTRTLVWTTVWTSWSSEVRSDADLFFFLILLLQDEDQDDDDDDSSDSDDDDDDDMDTDPLIEELTNNDNPDDVGRVDTPTEEEVSESWSLVFLSFFFL